ncbi:T9SS type A sorting domain-containing protein, partial [candidate division TA06 bacterium]|nr:T9SS type A sorting domain-containing protein [candidate division TA06 bacterium]
AAYGTAGEGYIANTVPAGMVWNTGTAAGVVTAVNNGTFMIMHRDHGMYTGWGEPAFTSTNIPSLTNNLYPFVFSMNCQTGAYQYSGEAFSEAFYRSKYGALGVMCATEVSYSFVNDALIMGISDGMWPNFNSTNNWDVPNAGTGQTYERYTEDLRPAFAMASGKWHLMTQTYTDPAIPADYKEFTCQLFHVFGDPFMTFCSQIPDTFTLTFNSTIPTGTQTFNVNVKNKAGANVLGALVGVYMPSNSPEIVTSALTDANGNVSITINPLLDGTLYVTATKSNFVRKETFTTVNAGTPTKPAITKLLDGAKLPDLRPYLTFVSTDPQGNTIDYRVIWDTTSAFTSAVRDSSTTTTYASGATVNFQFPSNLTAGRTYWWKVKGRDPAGTNLFGQSSDPRSFTISTDIPAGTVCWMHTKGGQFTCDTYTGATTAQGDSLILAAPSSGAATLMTENFEGGSLPAGWDTSGSYPANYGWLIRTSGGTQPPSYGTTYEGCQFPSTMVTPAASEEIITTPQYLMNSGAQTCSLSYGYGMDPGVAADSLVLEASFLSGGSWGTWIQVDGLNNGTTTISGTRSIGLNTFMPKDGIQLRWRFSQGGGRNGQDAAIDNITLKYTYLITNTNGTMTSGPIYYKDITKAETISRSSYRWGKVLWRKKAATDSIGVQVEYCNNNVWALVPDAALANNSKGFFNQASANDSVTLVTLDTLTYDSLRVIAKLYRPASKATANPVLYDIEFARPGYMAPDAVMLSFFAAFVQNNRAVVQWRTESEQDCYQWVVERSASPDGQFTELGRLDGNGTSSQPNEYSYSDAAVLTPGVYYYRITEIGKSGEKTVFGPVSASIGLGAPAEYALQPAYPNPSQGGATIKYSLKQPGQTLLKVYNVLGEEIKTLVNSRQSADYYQVNWDGRDKKGRLVSNGVYFYKLVSGDYSSTKKLTVLR